MSSEDFFIAAKKLRGRLTNSADLRQTFGIERP
jgi:hypothetical protein